MQAPAAHYLLFTDSDGRSCESSKWRFVLQPIGGGERIVAADAEADADGMRLALLAVVRGLEALDAPSRVTLLVANRFVRRGFDAISPNGKNAAGVGTLRTPGADPRPRSVATRRSGPGDS